MFQESFYSNTPKTSSQSILAKGEQNEWKENIKNVRSVKLSFLIRQKIFGGMKVVPGTVQSYASVRNVDVSTLLNITKIVA